MEMSNELKFSLFLICGFLNLKSQHLYISDAGNFQQGPHQIIKSDLDGGNAKLFIKDKLAWPQDILFLPDKKEVLVSNLSSGKIEKYHAETGVHISTFASGIQGTTRMKIGKDNLIYVLQWAGNGKVKRFDQTGKFIDDFTTTGVDQAIGLDWDKNGDLYVSSYRGLFIERFDTEGKSKGKFISTGLFGPTNIHFNEAGELIVLDYNSGRILLYTSNGTLIKTIAQGAAHCEGISFSKNGNMFIGTKSQINVYNIDGSFNKIITLPSDIKILNVNAVVE
jgi:sugar lactone lactonase YvrE